MSLVFHFYDMLGSFVCPLQSFTHFTQQIYVHNLHASYRPITHMTVWNYSICIVFDWYFVHVILSLILVQCSPPVESVYWFHVAIFSSYIVFPHLCGVKFLLCGLLSLICMNTVHQHSTICGQCSALGSQPRLGWLYQGRDFGGRSDLTELQGKPWHSRGKAFYRELQVGDDVLLDNLCLAGSCRGMEQFI